MLWQWSPSVIAELVASAILLVLAIYLPSRDINRQARFIGVTLVFVCALWILSHAVEIGLPVVSYKEFLVGTQLVLGIIALTFWLLYILYYLGPRKLLNRRIYILFGIMPLIAILALSTNNIYGLMWTGTGIDSQNPYLPLQPTYGIIYLACMFYMPVLVIVGSYLIFWNVIRHRFSYRRESIFLLVAAVIPLITAFIEITGLLSPLKIALGLTSWTACIGAIILALNLPQFRLEQVIPVARDIVFERIGDCILVLDMQERVLDLNPAAEQLLGYKISDAFGQYLERIWPYQSTQMIPFHKMVKEGEELVLERDGIQRVYDLRISTITDSVGHLTSQVVSLIDITERNKTQESLKQAYAKLKRTLETTVDTLANVTEIRDPYTAGHQKRVCDLCCEIAEEMGLPMEKLADIRTGSTLHDVGKMYIPAEILSKPGKLSEVEFSLIKNHPQVGYDIVKKIEFPPSVATMILQHHERLDGSGYPRGLHDGEIILEAKILALADVVEAMSSHRPYRQALGIGKALDEIAKNKGKLYDPAVVDACVTLITKKGFKFEN